MSSQPTDENKLFINEKALQVEHVIKKIERWNSLRRYLHHNHQYWYCTNRLIWVYCFVQYKIDYVHVILKILLKWNGLIHIFRHLHENTRTLKIYYFKIQSQLLAYEYRHLRYTFGWMFYSYHLICQILKVTKNYVNGVENQGFYIIVISNIQTANSTTNIISSITLKTIICHIHKLI